MTLSTRARWLLACAVIGGRAHAGLEFDGAWVNEAFRPVENFAAERLTNQVQPILTFLNGYRLRFLPMNNEGWCQVAYNDGKIRGTWQPFANALYLKNDETLKVIAKSPLTESYLAYVPGREQTWLLTSHQTRSLFKKTRGVGAVELPFDGSRLKNYEFSKIISHGEEFIVFKPVFKDGLESPTYVVKAQGNLVQKVPFQATNMRNLTVDGEGDLLLYDAADRPHHVSLSDFHNEVLWAEMKSRLEPSKPAPAPPRRTRSAIPAKWNEFGTIETLPRDMVPHYPTAEDTVGRPSFALAFSQPKPEDPINVVMQPLRYDKTHKAYTPSRLKGAPKTWTPVAEELTALSPDTECRVLGGNIFALTPRTKTGYYKFGDHRFGMYGELSADYQSAEAEVLLVDVKSAEHRSTWAINNQTHAVKLPIDTDKMSAYELAVFTGDPTLEKYLAFTPIYGDPSTAETLVMKFESGARRTGLQRVQKLPFRADLSQIEFRDDRAHFRSAEGSTHKSIDLKDFELESEIRKNGVPAISCFGNLYKK